MIIAEFKSNSIYKVQTRVRRINEGETLIASGFAYIIRNPSETDTLVIDDKWEIEPLMVDGTPDCSLPVYYSDRLEFYWKDTNGNRVNSADNFLTIRETINPLLELECKKSC